MTTTGVSPPPYLPKTKPTLTLSQHAPGVKVGNDLAPEFAAQTLPAGTAPTERTFKPNPVSETPGQGNNPNIAKETWTSASDTIGGATSADVHTGLGHPGSGQTSSELRSGNSERAGLEGRGVAGGDSFAERGLDTDRSKGVRGYGGETDNRGEILGAEEREPVGAEEVAAEFE